MNKVKVNNRSISSFIDIKNLVGNFIKEQPSLYSYDDTTGYSISFGETVGDCADVGLFALRLRKIGISCNVVQMYKSSGGRLENPNHAILLIETDSGLTVFDPTLYVYDLVLLPKTVEEKPSEYVHSDMEKTIGMITSYRKIDPNTFGLDETIDVFERRQRSFNGSEKYDYFTTQPIDITTLKQNIAMRNRPGGKIVSHIKTIGGELFKTLYLKRNDKGDIGYYNNEGGFIKGSINQTCQLHPSLLSIYPHTSQTLKTAFENRKRQQTIVSCDFSEYLCNIGKGVYSMLPKEGDSNFSIGFIPSTNTGAIQNFLGKHLLRYANEEKIQFSGLNIIEESHNSSITEKGIIDYYTNYIAFLQKKPCNVLFLESDSYILLCNIAKKLHIDFSSFTQKCIIFNPLDNPRDYIDRIHRKEFPNYIYHYGHNKYVGISKSDLFVSDDSFKLNVSCETMTTPKSLRKTLYQGKEEGPVPILSSHHLIEQLPHTIKNLLFYYTNNMALSLLQLPNNQTIEYVYEKPQERNGLTCLYIHGFKASGTSGTKSSQTKYAMIDNNIAFLGFNFRGNNLEYNDSLPYEKMNFDTMANDVITMIEYAIANGAKKKSIIVIPSSLGSSAIIQSIMKQTDLCKYIKHIYFLAPCVNFGEYKTTQAIQKGELTEEELCKRKIKGQRQELHFRKNIPVYVGRKLIQDGLEQQQAMIDFVHQWDIQTTIFHGTADDQIYPENGKILAGDKHTYYEIAGADHQFSSHTNDILVYILQEQLLGFRK